MHCTFALSNPRPQSLHVLLHLLWYAVAGPVLHGDWALALLHAAFLAYCGAMVVLAASPRGGSLWAAWRRCVALLLMAQHGWGSGNGTLRKVQGGWLLVLVADGAGVLLQRGGTASWSV